MELPEHKFSCVALSLNATRPIAIVRTDKPGSLATRDYARTARKDGGGSS